jgi:hypothetical protein
LEPDYFLKASRVIILKIISTSDRDSFISRNEQKPGNKYRLLSFIVVGTVKTHFWVSQSLCARNPIKENLKTHYTKETLIYIGSIMYFDSIMSG